MEDWGNRVISALSGVHSGNELAVWEWEGRRGGGEIGWAGLDSALPKVIKANDSPGRLS